MGNEYIFYFNESSTIKRELYPDKYHPQPKTGKQGFDYVCTHPQAQTRETHSGLYRNAMSTLVAATSKQQLWNVPLTFFTPNNTRSTYILSLWSECNPLLPCDLMRFIDHATNVQSCQPMCACSFLIRTPPTFLSSNFIFLPTLNLQGMGAGGRCTVALNLLI